MYELTQNNLRLLESFSIEEKLNFPLVAFEQDIFSMDGALESDVYLERMAEDAIDELQENGETKSKGSGSEQST